MERVLLGASLAVGLIVYLCRFLPGAGSGGARRSAPPLDTRLLLAAVLLPALGFAVTLPSAGPLFAPGQRLGLGLLVGGIGALLSTLPLSARRGTAAAAAVTVPPPALLFASTLAMSVATVTCGLVLLRASLMDGLMGIAIGWLCAAFPLYLAIPPERRGGIDGSHLAYGAGVTAALAAGAALGAYRDPLTPHLERLTWSGCLLGFAAFGALVTVGMTVAGGGGRAVGAGRVVPFSALLIAGGLGLLLIATKIVGDTRLAVVGVGGLLLWPVALALLRDGVTRDTAAARSFAVPVLPVVLVTTGFLAAIQTLQGYGAALAVTALFVALPATFALAPGLTMEAAEDGEAPLGPSAVALLTFSALLLLWRLFVTRWAGDLRGVTLTDQYALFGFVLGAAFPALLASFPARWSGRAAVPLAAAVLSGVLVLAAPGSVLVLFGAKSLVALMIGLALGVVLARGRDAGPSALAGLLALGVALALDQFTGRVLPESDPTRADRIRWLVGMMAVVAAGVLAADRLGSGGEDDTREATPSVAGNHPGQEE